MSEQKPNYKDVRNNYDVYGNQGIENPVDKAYLPQPYEHRTESLYDESNVNVKDFVIGAFVGGIVGAATALFLAPKTGKELRDNVATQASQLKDKSIEFSSTAKEKSVQISKTLQEQSGQLVDKVKSIKSKTSQPLDDGTVSFEGEEPLDIMETMEKTIAEYEAEDNEPTAVSLALEEAVEVVEAVTQEAKTEVAKKS
ncbi:YtxH domain-containing protein [Viridibacillus sp. YIM B01967]|uniref:YtxH domain-containing protein n=1 Tax=Viridibacillus soli TaxID=2798301 RepID=A0ABS1H9F6_9BACL|nr:YtxH domain-containing protein [Viridibacillus soli]MBK3496050.1 YtxH domain-containing protein [Viridibacillus soli]